MKSKENEFDCIDCGTNTLKIHEYYMVENKVWRKAKMKEGMLCIGCLEKRIKRHLNSEDFTKCPLNFDPNHNKSNRLTNRMTNGFSI